MKKAISILSGGLDSAVATAIAQKEFNMVVAVTFNYGQRAASKEIAAAAYLCDLWKIEHRVINLEFLSKIGNSSLTSETIEIPRFRKLTKLADKKITSKTANNVWVPNRNGIFINIVAAIAETDGIEWIITGFNREEAEAFPDNSKKFLEEINRSLQESTLAKPKVASPTIDMDKKEIVKAAIDMGVELSKLWYCYEGGEEPCGTCESCARFKRAMTPSP